MSLNQLSVGEIVDHARTGRLLGQVQAIRRQRQRTECPGDWIYVAGQWRHESTLIRSLGPCVRRESARTSRKRGE